MYLRPDSETKKKTEKTCGCCGLVGHYANDCNEKSSVYIVEKYPEGRKIKDYPIVPTEMLNKLRRKSWDALGTETFEDDDDIDEEDDGDDVNNDMSNQDSLILRIPHVSRLGNNNSNTTNNTNSSNTNNSNTHSSNTHSSSSSANI
jgi:hypothetical protein